MPATSSLVIQPFRSIGPIALGDGVDSIKSLGLQYDATLSKDGVKCYQSTGFGLICYVKHDRVKSVACWKNCTYKDVNLIGLGELDLETLLGKPESSDSPVWVSDNRWQKAAEYDSLGLIIWLEHGRTVKVDLWWDGRE